MADVHGERNWVAPAFIGVIVLIGVIPSTALLIGR